MIGFKKRDTKDLLKIIAHQQGISVAEVRAEMQMNRRFIPLYNLATAINL